MSEPIRRLEVDEDWADLADQWDLDPQVAYLNHGSFGPPPRSVREARRACQDAMDAQPMDFFYRQLEPRLNDAREAMAQFVAARPECMALVDNATYGMNVVADSVPIEAGDEILLNNHEYGAVHRIWERKCRSVGATVQSVALPSQFQSPDEIVDRLVDAMHEKTRLVVISHITSPTAAIFPVDRIIAAAQARGIPVCVDGPHAVAQLPLNLAELGCDFYTASCHKWLCGGFGSGFIYVAEKWHDRIHPPVLGWGRLLPARPERWDEEFLWRGTRDIGAAVSLPAAIEFMRGVGLESFRARTHYLSQGAARRAHELFGTEPCAPADRQWYGSMSLIKLPPGDWSGLQNRLWNGHRIEVPVVWFDQQWFVRVSSHLYTTHDHIDRLLVALEKEIK